jgi:Uma2 family endonuclease
MAMLGSEQLAVHFPDSAEMPEGRRHFELRTLIFDFLRLAFGDVATIGSDQFVYWEPSNPRACLSPDAFLRFGAKDEHFRSWKVWERGVPQLAVEIISDSESELSWDEKFERYQQLGVSELIWFDPETPARPLRVWDLVGDDLLERYLPEPIAESRQLGGYWLPVEDPTGGLTLRLSRDEHGLALFPTAAEHNAQLFLAEAEARQLETEARRAAERRIAELEAELKRKS